MIGGRTASLLSVSICDTRIIMAFILASQTVAKGMRVGRAVEGDMLHQLSNEIAECYLRAEQARLRAKQAHDAALKQEFLDMERRWISLAR
jgi:hypothetical protein